MSTGLSKNFYEHQIECFKKNINISGCNYQMSPYKQEFVSIPNAPHIISITVNKIDKKFLDEIRDIAKQLMKNRGITYRICLDGTTAGINHTIFFRINPKDWALEIKDDFTCQNYDEYKEYWLKNHVTINTFKDVVPEKKDVKKSNVPIGDYEKQNTKMDTEDLDVFSEKNLKTVKK